MLEMSSCQWELHVPLSITAVAEIGVGTGRPNAGSQRSHLFYLTSSGDLSSLSSHLALEFILLTTIILCKARCSVRGIVRKDDFITGVGLMLLISVKGSKKNKCLEGGY